MGMMGVRLALVIATALTIHTAAHAAVPIDDLEAAVGRIDPNRTSQADCDQAVAASNDSNAPTLFYGAVVCRVARSEVDANFLLLAGQIRAFTDFSVFGVLEDESGRAVRLYTMIGYGGFGGAGMESVYADPHARASLLARFDAWEPPLKPDYDPGWTSSARPSAEAYAAAMKEVKANRRRQLEDYTG